jgi:aquaporin Z
MTRTQHLHWPEYAIEATLLGSFMIALGLCATLLEHPDSPVRQALADPFVRRALMGGAMGVLLAGLIYTPWGHRSGAHLNPALTLAFWWLRKVSTWDAVFYVAAQFAGALAGTTVVAILLGELFLAPPIQAAATTPGDMGIGLAFLAEAVMAFVLMLLILVVSNRAPIAGYTGLVVGLLVAAFITLEAPLSGTSLNPARTVASALPAGVWTGVWLYFAAPTLGMLAAAQVFLLLPSQQALRCPKLCPCSPDGHPHSHCACIFCDKPAVQPEREAHAVLRQ